MRIISLNLNGIRSASSKGWAEWLIKQDPDIVCVQELKAQASDMTSDMLSMTPYFGHFHYAEKKGYSGVGIYSKRKPDAVIEGLGIPEFDAEGRYIEARFGNLSIVSVYLPSGSSGEERQTVKFKFMAEFMPLLRDMMLNSTSNRGVEPSLLPQTAGFASNVSQTLLRDMMLNSTSNRGVEPSLLPQTAGFASNVSQTLLRDMMLNSTSNRGVEPSLLPQTAGFASNVSQTLLRDMMLNSTSNRGVEPSLLPQTAGSASNVSQPLLRDMMQSGREFIICGDWNIAHTEKDLKNWRGNKKNSGFLPEERAWFTELFSEVGFVDVFRRLYPELEAYTWWSNRGQAWAKDVGWRLDYQIATPLIARTAQSASIYKEQRFSDHAPLTIDYELNF